LDTAWFSLFPYYVSIIQTKPFLYRHEIRGIEKLNIEEQEGTTHASPEVRTSLRALWAKTRLYVIKHLQGTKKNEHKKAIWEGQRLKHECTRFTANAKSA